MKHFVILSLVTCSLLSGALSKAQAGLLTPTPYLAFDNAIPGAGTSISPFSGQSFDYFHLQTFETVAPGGIFAGNEISPGAFLTQLSGVGGGNGSVISPAQSANEDSVDADDGTIDGSSAGGQSLFTNTSPTGFKFSFSLSALGKLPTHAGLVWTDGAWTVSNRTANVIFEAFGPNDESLGVITATGFQDTVITGTTAEDRFFGVTNAQGISAIAIRAVGGSGSGMEIDHLQYGAATVVPEPGTIAVWSVLGLVAVGYRRWMR